MPILPISHDACLGDVFCDYVNITTPKENLEEIRGLLQPYLDVIGCLQSIENLFLMRDKGGAFKIYLKQSVAVYSFSGGVLSALRASTLLDDVLTVFSDYAYKVSTLHATQDYSLNASPIVNKVYKDANDGLIKLSRKSLARNNIHKYVSMNDEGDDTGTVYLGNRANSDIWARVYDKQKERHDKGFTDCPSITRVEMVFQTDVGCTLRDVQNPHDVFFHYASKSLVQAPKDFKGWKSYAIPFKIERQKTDLTTWKRIWGVVEFSNDIERIIDLAVADYGNDALDEITKLIKKRMRLRTGRNL